MYIVRYGLIDNDDDEEEEEEGGGGDGLLTGAEPIAGKGDCHGQIGPRESPFFDAGLVSKLWLLLLLVPFGAAENDWFDEIDVVLVGVRNGTILELFGEAAAAAVAVEEEEEEVRWCAIRFPPDWIWFLNSG